MLKIKYEEKEKIFALSEGYFFNLLTRSLWLKSKLFNGNARLVSALSINFVYHYSIGHPLNESSTYNAASHGKKLE